jgi:hypothetical protein
MDVDVEWRIGSTNTEVQEGLGSIPHPNAGWHFLEALISLLSDNMLKNNFIHL